MATEKTRPLAGFKTSRIWRAQVRIFTSALFLPHPGLPTTSLLPITLPAQHGRFSLPEMSSPLVGLPGGWGEAGSHGQLPRLGLDTSRFPRPVWRKPYKFARSLACQPHGKESKFVCLRQSVIFLPKETTRRRDSCRLGWITAGLHHEYLYKTYSWPVNNTGLCCVVSLPCRLFSISLVQYCKHAFS